MDRAQPGCAGDARPASLVALGDGKIGSVSALEQAEENVPGTAGLRTIHRRLSRGQQPVRRRDAMKFDRPLVCLNGIVCCVFHKKFTSRERQSDHDNTS